MPITYCKWQSHTWKNELARQSESVAVYLSEALDDENDLGHNPYHMLDHSIVLSAFAIRRMIEKRLITDKLAKTDIDVRTFPSRSNGNFRHPYIGYAGEDAFRNYDFQNPLSQRMKIGEVANEIIHASQIMVSKGEAYVKDGLLVAPDRNLKHRLLHLTIADFLAMTKLVLDDFVRFEREEWDPGTGQTSAVRE